MDENSKPHQGASAMEQNSKPHQGASKMEQNSKPQQGAPEKRPWPRGEEKRKKMGIECKTCGRPFDDAFFSRRIVQLSQRKGELECPNQPKVRVRACTDEGIGYSWQVIQDLEDKIKKLKRDQGVKNLGIQPKTKVPKDGEEKEEEGKN